MSNVAKPYLATVHCVERKVWPYKSEVWQSVTREYFATGDLADKVERFYREHMSEVPGGIDVDVQTVRVLVIDTQYGRTQLNELNNNGKPYLIEKVFDLVHRAKSLMLLGEWVQDQMKANEAKKVDIKFNATCLKQPSNSSGS